MSQKRKRSPSPPTSTTVYRSTKIEDRASTFIGLYSPTIKPKELQALPEISSADHRIHASRRESNQQAITGSTKYVTDHDDDGEKYAGKKVAKVLENMNVTGACVVARWYGGVMLGPVRFEHIERCAREAVQKWRENVEGERMKKRKAEQEALEKPRVEKVLVERDGSIEVLRKLALEKEEMLKEARAESAGQKEEENVTDGVVDASSIPSSSAAQRKSAPDYKTMPLERLKALEKARDATLSFLLKRIDKAEAELANSQEAKMEPP